MKIEKTLILVGILLIILSITVQAVPILPLIARGNIQIDGQEAELGTKIIAKIDNVEKGSTIVKDKGSYIILVNGEAEDQEKTVEFYINELKSEQTAIFRSSGIVDLDLSVNTESPPEQPDLQPDDDEEGQTDDEEDEADDEESSSRSSRRPSSSREEEVVESKIGDSSTESEEKIEVVLLKKEESLETDEELPVTGSAVINILELKLWQGIAVVIVIILIALLIAGFYYKKKKREI